MHVRKLIGKYVLFNIHGIYATNTNRYLSFHAELIWKQTLMVKSLIHTKHSPTHTYVCTHTDTHTRAYKRTSSTSNRLIVS